MGCLKVIKKKKAIYFFSLIMYVAIAIGLWFAYYNVRIDEVYQITKEQYSEDGESEFNCWNCGIDLSRKKCLICQSCEWNICAYCGACASPMYGGCDSFEDTGKRETYNYSDILWRENKDLIIEKAKIPTKKSLYVTGIVSFLIGIGILYNDCRKECSR